MIRPKLLAIEAALLAAGLAISLVILLRPFESSGVADTDTEVRAGIPDATGAAEGGAGNTLAVAVTPRRPPAGDACGPPVDREFLSANQILSYYGNPYVAAMGILGELDPQELVARLKAHARKYDELNGFRGVRPALHLVYATAQKDPGREGAYLLYVDDKTLKEYIDLACQNGLFIFLDLQIGRSTAEAEVKKVLPYLRQSHVQLALDPEFAMPPGEVPGQAIGSLDAADINAAQKLIQDFTEENNLPDKILVVHQFQASMVTRPELIQDYARVHLVMDMDGFGPSAIKVVKYGWYAAPSRHPGIKLFFKHDLDLMSEEDVLALQPTVIIYQ